MVKSYYRVLGVPPGASTDEIERAFRAAARRVHPDLHGGDGAAEERMKELNEIRATLTDPALRAAYDDRLRAQHAGASAARASQQPPPDAPGPQPWAPERSAAWLGVKAGFAPPPAVGAPRFTVSQPPAWRAGLGLMWARLPGRKLAPTRPGLGAAMDVAFLLVCLLFAFVVLRLVLLLKSTFAPGP